MIHLLYLLHLLFIWRQCAPLFRAGPKDDYSNGNVSKMGKKTKPQVEQRTMRAGCHSSARVQIDISNLSLPAQAVARVKHIEPYGHTHTFLFFSLSVVTPT
jgi:hypothetical protein